MLNNWKYWINYILPAFSGVIFHQLVFEKYKNTPLREENWSEIVPNVYKCTQFATHMPQNSSLLDYINISIQTIAYVSPQRHLLDYLSPFLASGK